MILDLEKTTQSERVIEGDEVVTFHDLSGERNVIDCHVELGVRQLGDTYYLDINVTGLFETVCHKCLEPASCDLATSFKLVAKRLMRGHVDVSGEADDFIQLAAGESRLQLDPYIYENLISSIPIQIYCRSDCRGLCAGCGRNLNRESCACDEKSDTRWEALRKIKDAFPK